mmetsp:Transcript_13597/g.32254  ORF Transcript_13597/g.32254 Transcript_13597/m.32254 type:complete len:134 (-) Transcript_13597:219-620(-)
MMPLPQMPAANPDPERLDETQVKTIQTKVINKLDPAMPERLSGRWRLHLVGLTMLVLFVGLGLFQQVGVIILMALGIVRIWIFGATSFFTIFRSRRDLANLDGVQSIACKSGAAAAREHGRGDEESGPPPTSQ